MPIAVVAEQLGHADTRMTEKHYAISSDVADSIRARFPTIAVPSKGMLTDILVDVAQYGFALVSAPFYARFSEGFMLDACKRATAG